jgi:glycosyltransferase involved in cell wall biosynthesis
MRICLVSSSSGSRGGGEFYLIELAKGLRTLGHEVNLLINQHESMDDFAAMCDSDDLQVERTAYTNTYHRRFRVLGAISDKKGIRATQTRLQGLHADIVHLNHQNVEDGLDLVMAAKACGLPTVSTIHVTKSMSSLGAAAGKLRDFVARRSWQKARIPTIAISDASAQCLAEFLQSSVTVSSTRTSDDSTAVRPVVYSVPNGVATPDLTDRAALRALWNISEDQIVLGCIARLEQQKNPTFIARLVPHLPDNVRVVWIGDGRLRSQMEESLRSAGITDRVVLDGWQNDASSRLSGFDIFVLPSLYEGLPLALLESMAAGLPGVASSVDGTRDAVLDGLTGRLCAVNDIEEWCSALLPLINSPDKRLTMGAAAKQRHAEQFSLAAMAERTVTVYRQVIETFSE